MTPAEALTTGLGAVVEATAYSSEIRTFVRLPIDTSPWFDSGPWSDASGNGHTWSELEDVQVLHYGYLPEGA